MKDLRQSLRSGGFIGIFLWVHVSLALLVGMHAMAIANGDDSRELSAFFWADMGLIFCALCPFRELSGRAIEARQKIYLDLVNVTPISSDGIAFQRWKSGALLMLVIAISTTPYVILRYYVGSELLSDLMTIGVLFGDGLVLLSITILMSGVSTVVRVVMTIALLIFGLPLYGNLSAMIVIRSPLDFGLLFVWLLTSSITFMITMALASDVHGTPLPDRA
ncbi:MAG: hypothetical protein H7A55_01580 [Verrucomicrobiaceae bacterium]|nr:hypothetical protein [Verrucomicrobiaceae bacterium]